MPETTDPTSAGRDQIAADIRQKIVTGDLPTESPLPSNRALAEQYQTSGLTVQRAMKLLVEQGFVESAPRKGRFVRTFPPNQRRVGLVFPGHPDEIRSNAWNLRYAAIWEAAQRVNGATDWELVPYFDLDPTEKGNPSPGYDALMEDLHADQLRALFFTYPPYGLSKSELLTRCPVPLMSLAAGSNFKLRVRLDKAAFWERAVQWLVERNRRQLAWVTILKLSVEETLGRLQHLADRYGFDSPARWIHPMDPYYPKWVQHTLGAMLDAPAGERPDGLVIMDDHLVEPVERALLELGVDLSRELEVVGYWNFPLPYTEHAPIQRMGADLVEFLHTALQCLSPASGGGKERGVHQLAPIDAAEFEKRCAGGYAAHGFAQPVPGPAPQKAEHAVDD